MSDFQLAEWRRRGLVPRPDRGRGLGRGKGREYCYPAGTANLVRRIVKWLRWDRRLDVVGWCLWSGPELFPDCYLISDEIAASSVDSIIGRYVDLDLWGEEAHPESQHLNEMTFFEGLKKWFNRQSSTGVDAEDLVFTISTIARDAEANPRGGEKGWVGKIQASYRFADWSPELRDFAKGLFDLLHVLIPGWTTLYGPMETADKSPRGAQDPTHVPETALLDFTALLVSQRELFDPRFLGRWMRDSRNEAERIETQKDLRAMSRALFPERFGKEPPSPLLLWLLLLVRRTGVTFHGARDAYGWFSVLERDTPNPAPPRELDPLRRVVDSMPVKKSYLRGRPDEDDSDR